MPSRQPFNPDHYLNRLALEKMDSPYSIDPYPIIKAFFEHDRVDKIIDMFRLCCQAGLAEAYQWKQGTPGNLVFFYERLEMLVEAAYLISIQPKNGHAKQPPKETTEIPASWLKKMILPCVLSTHELHDPLFVIKQFFTIYRLDKWKQLIHYWMEAGLSNYSIIEGIDVEDLLPYCLQVEKLMYATYWMVLTDNP